MKPSNDAPLKSLPGVPWSPWLGLVFVLAVFYAAQVLAGLAVSIYPLFKHWNNAQATAWLNGSVPAQFVFIFLAETLTVGAIYLFLKRRYRLGLAAIGLQRPSWLDAAYGVSAYVPYFVLYLLIIVGVKHFVPGLNTDQTQDIGFNHVHDGLQLTLTFLSLVVFVPLAEEIMVRGFLYSTLKKALPTVYAVLLTSGLFAAAHLQEGGGAGLLWIGALDTFVLSLVLIYLREKTGSLWASITLHAIKNGVAYVSIFILHVH